MFSAAPLAGIAFQPVPFDFSFGWVLVVRGWHRYCPSSFLPCHLLSSNRRWMVGYHVTRCHHQVLPCISLTRGKRYSRQRRGLRAAGWGPVILGTAPSRVGRECATAFLASNGLFGFSEGQLFRGCG